jgi:hypothetical protein
MFEFDYLIPFAIIDGVKYELYSFDKSSSNSVLMYMKNEQYEWGTTAVVDQTTINGVLQTIGLIRHGMPDFTQIIR